MRVDHGCRHILVTKQRLDVADVGARLEQVSGNGVPEVVRTDRPCDPRIVRSLCDGALDRLRVDNRENER